LAYEHVAEIIPDHIRRADGAVERHPDLDSEIYGVAPQTLPETVGQLAKHGHHIGCMVAANPFPRIDLSEGVSHPK
jgi:hypothetical protein